MSRKLSLTLGLIGLLFLSGCATYTTPSAGVDISAVSDVSIAELMSRKPAAEYPARIAIARIASPGYISDTNRGYGSGNFSLLTARDVESDADIERLETLKSVEEFAPLSKLLVPNTLNSIDDLRVSAAHLKTDMLLIYSIDTVFRVEGKPLGPLTTITLGFLPNQQASVTATTSAVLMDVRTGYVYGVTEATSTQEQNASLWSTHNAVEKTRRRAEEESYKAFLTEFEKLWPEVLAKQSK